MGAFAEYTKPCNVVTGIFRGTQYPRKEPRRLVEELIASSRKPPTTKGKEAALLELTKARDALTPKAPTDTARLNSIVAAEKFYENALEQLKTGPTTTTTQPQKNTQQPRQTQTLSQEDAKRQTQLELRLTELDKTIATVNVAGKDGPAIMPAKKEWETSFLQGGALQIREQLEGAMSGDDLDKVEQRLLVLRTQIGEVELFVSGARSIVTGLRESGGLLDLGKQALETLKTELKGGPVKPEDTRLADLVTKLDGASSPAKRVEFNGLQSLVSQLQDELRKIDENPGGYAASVKQSVGSQKRLTVAYSLYDEWIDPKRFRLAELAGPLDKPIAGEMVKKNAEYRGKIPEILKTIEGDPQQGALTGDFGDILESEILKLQREATALRNDVHRMRVQLNVKIGDKVGELLPTKTLKLFGTEWNQIDSAQASILQLLPGDAPLTGATLANLVAAKSLVEQVQKLADGIEKNRSTASSFDQDIANFEKSIKENIDTKMPFGKYDAATIKTIDEKFKKFKSEQPTLPAANAQTILTELRNNFASSLLAANELGTYLDQTVLPPSKQWRLLLDQATASEMNGSAPKLNSLAEAFKPFDTAMAAAPLVKADIEKAFAVLQKAFANINTWQEAAQVAKASYPELKKQADEKTLKDKEDKERLEQLVKVLEERLKTARAEVKKVNGDENAISAIKTLIEQAKEKIGIPEADAAQKLLDRVAQRIDLVFSNPQGGMARKKADLDTLHKEWTTARLDAFKKLEIVAAKIGEYVAPDDTSRSAVDELVNRVREYMLTFTGGNDPLDGPIGILADKDAPEPRRRKAREDGLAAVLDLMRGLQAHPLTTALAMSPIPEARAVPKRLIDKLDFLQFSILTSVE